MHSNPSPRRQARPKSTFLAAKTPTSTSPSNITSSNNPPPESTILFLYTNRPSVILGRNQNPYVEINLDLLRASNLKPDLVRRRSGGGTVFHDEGNVNYSVICPTKSFHRDKHAEMVVRALQKLNVEGVRVNERHDIVADRPHAIMPLKVSGSAYKLTRLRSLHHGTCLLNSSNLQLIGSMLKSPGKKYIEARGVESVSSPITNVDVQNEEFENAVVEEFGEMYESVEPIVVGEKEGEIPEIAEGMGVLKSDDWVYGETPQFTVNVFVEHPFKKVDGKMLKFSICLTARHGAITKIDASFEPSKVFEENATSIANLGEKLVGKKIHEIYGRGWEILLCRVLGPATKPDQELVVAAAMQLQEVLGTRDPEFRGFR
ncbi:hypothetical protein G7Y89_g10058 [Cudoniella acicularis]|uniref:Putative lipoate-protein ligase A n=1 Tax=Cudoniella acicularis TaxID=354080 RepID=A0A8H4W200_9HELO|nr:hypothetical protein G7Y89_g10058 [Cudoniella acicularis]